jgi:Tetracyclin repressor-like, C-terminal domain
VPRPAGRGTQPPPVPCTHSTGQIPDDTGAPNPVEAAQEIWSALHGAVALELKGLVLTPDPEATYAALLDTVISGLTPKVDNGLSRR